MLTGFLTCQAVFRAVRYTLWRLDTISTCRCGHQSLIWVCLRREITVDLSALVLNGSLSWQLGSRSSLFLPIKISDCDDWEVEIDSYPAQLDQMHLCHDHLPPMVHRHSLYWSPIDYYSRTITSLLSTCKNHQALVDPAWYDGGCASPPSKAWSLGVDGYILLASNCRNSPCNCLSWSIWDMMSRSSCERGLSWGTPASVASTV